MDTVKSLPGVTEPGDLELIGFSGRQVVVAAGDDRGLEVGRLIDARDLICWPVAGLSCAESV